MKNHLESFPALKKILQRLDLGRAGRRLPAAPLPGRQRAGSQWTHV
jgi:hypothetical protein